MSESDLTGLSVDQLRSSVRSLERELIAKRYRQLQAFAELADRGIESLGLRGLADLVQVELNCTRPAARAIVMQVQRFVGRNAVCGEPLVPVFPLVAEALSTGKFGFEQAKVIAEVIESLPDPVRAEHADPVERTLTELAAEHDPSTLKTLARRIVAHLDPDGPEPVEEQQYRLRRLMLGENADSTGFLEANLTRECRAVWEAVLTPLAAQRADGELGPDSRTVWQRWHDAFEEAGRLLLRSKELPRRAGLPAELLITIELRDLEARVGQATTHHGGLLSIEQALQLAADAKVIPVVLDQELGLMELGRGRRLASAGQRKALFARDRGCTFPGCSKTAAESEIHHVRDWSRGGGTDLGNLTITCGYHNNEAPRQGWQTVMIGGTPHWRPPRWRDPDQRPKRNWVHHPELLLPSRE